MPMGRRLADAIDIHKPYSIQISYLRRDYIISVEIFYVFYNIIIILIRMQFITIVLK